ncbi:hypothetical protein PDE_06436 [Penicillium oxalicum 114-2]|uniref:Uncharacterized protein n=1 Tax=Penicillium oxalicum (strain 114-2 / CGMCC 5302) TaxID=933388 RepID=S7ZS05_PENO1|nr:hypothetical protein PDE_06436 [Penicillium oxalicum 114-2]
MQRRYKSRYPERQNKTSRQNYSKHSTLHGSSIFVTYPTANLQDSGKGVSSAGDQTTQEDGESHRESNMVKRSEVARIISAKKIDSGSITTGEESSIENQLWNLYFPA